MLNQGAVTDAPCMQRVEVDRDGRDEVRGMMSKAVKCGQHLRVPGALRGCSFTCVVWREWWTPGEPLWGP